MTSYQQGGDISSSPKVFPQQQDLLPNNQSSQNKETQKIKCIIEYITGGTCLLSFHSVSVILYKQ
jgi:hypothetical protein